MPKILLVTSVAWCCAERVADALAPATIEAIFPEGHVIARSRYLRARHPYRSLTPLLSIRRAIAKAKPDLVVPTEDRAAALLATLYAQGTAEEKALLVRSLGNPGIYARLADRSAFVAEAAEAGVRVAPMLRAPNLAALEQGLQSFGLPLVIKSDQSCGGEGVAIAKSEAEAREIFARLSHAPSRPRTLMRAARRRDSHFLREVLAPRQPKLGSQKFIPGHPATSSLFCWQGEVLAANHFDVAVTQRPNGPSSVLTRRDDPQMDDAARRLARRFNLSGLHGLDYMIGLDGQPYLLEINLRATPTSHLALGEGHDPCGALLGQLGLAVDRPAVTAKRQIALFPQEIRRDRASPWLADAFHDVPRNDPAVALALAGAFNAEGPSQSRDLGDFDLAAGNQSSPALTIRQAAAP